MKRPFQAKDFTIGWICALLIEYAAAKQVLDIVYDRPDWLALSYSLGRISNHDIVVECLPEGYMGTNAAAVLATQMRSDFPSLRFGILVGIGSGVPEPEDVRLGDIVIGVPNKGYDGCVQYDIGKADINGFERTGYSNRPPTVLLQVVSNLRAEQYQYSIKVWEHIVAFELLPQFQRPSTTPDILFQANSEHTGGADCSRCDQTAIIADRPYRKDSLPRIHYGTVASGNQVIKNAQERDRLSSELKGVLCFEIEAAGLIDFPALIIRGIYDYADSHKNKSWQPYAAATAAACAKEIISLLPTLDSNMHRPRPVASHQSTFMVPFGQDRAFVGREAMLADLDETTAWDRQYHRRMALVGLGGIGYMSTILVFVKY